MLARVVVFLVGFLMLTFGVLLVFWAGSTAYRFQWQLQRSSAVETDARVTDLRVLEDQRTHAETHEVRYAFKVQGDDTTYRYDDDIWFIQQGDGWIDVSEDVYEQAREDRKLDVEYLDGKPDVNQPVDARRGLGSAILFSVLGLVSAAIGALLVFRRARPSSPLTT